MARRSGRFTSRVKVFSGARGVCADAAPPRRRLPTYAVGPAAPSGALWYGAGRKRVPGADRIKILEDTDGDGKIDKVTVFADNIYPVPMGLAIQEIWKDGKYKGCRVFQRSRPVFLTRRKS